MSEDVATVVRSARPIAPKAVTSPGEIQWRTSPGQSSEEPDNPSVVNAEPPANPEPEPPAEPPPPPTQPGNPPEPTPPEPTPPAEPVAKSREDELAAENADLKRQLAEQQGKTEDARKGLFNKSQQLASLTREVVAAFGTDTEGKARVQANDLFRTTLSSFARDNVDLAIYKDDVLDIITNNPNIASMPSTYDALDFALAKARADNPARSRQPDNPPAPPRPTGQPPLSRGNAPQPTTIGRVPRDAVLLDGKPITKNGKAVTQAEWNKMSVAEMERLLPGDTRQ